MTWRPERHTLEGRVAVVAGATRAPSAAARRDPDRRRHLGRTGRAAPSSWSCCSSRCGDTGPAILKGWFDRVLGNGFVFGIRSPRPVTCLPDRDLAPALTGNAAHRVRERLESFRQEGTPWPESTDRRLLRATIRARWLRHGRSMVQPDRRRAEV